MKVLVSAYACNPAGSLALHPGEDLAGWKLMRQLARFNDLWIITHAYNRPEIKGFPGQGDPSGVKFHFVDLPPWLRWLYKIEFGQRIYYYLWQIKAWRVARRLHKTVGFDAAHHLTFGNDWIPSFIGAFLPVPFIWGPVGGGQRTPKKLRPEYSLYGRLAERVRSTAQWFGRRDLVRRRCLKRAKAVLVCNEETKLKMPAKHEKKIFYFPVNGISPEDLAPAEAPAANPKGFRVLTAGRLHRLKGFSLAVRALGELSGKVPEAELVIVGTGPEENRLKSLAKNLGMESRIHFTPWLSRAEVLREMRACDVFLFPSFRDGGGAVVVEAMASGKPVVCIDSGGPGNHVQEAWGVKILPGRPDEVVERITAALLKAAADPEWRLRLGREARRRAEEFYVWDKLGDRMDAIYRHALAGVPLPGDFKIGS